MISLSRNTLTAYVLVAAVLGGVIGGAFGILAVPFLDRVDNLAPGGGFITPPPVLNQLIGIAEDEQSIAVVRRAQPAVVSIVITKDVSKIRQPRFIDPFTGDPILPERSPGLNGQQRIGGGSGFFVSADGLLVTNRHVVQDAEATYTVVLDTGEELPAKVLARDPVLDLAVLDVEGDNHPYLTFGDSDELKLGQTVIAIGNALDEFRNSVTKGIVSGLNRRLTANDMGDAVTLEEAIQTDAAINPGNSGGPLIDLHGRVVGVNTAVSFSGQLLGFALPGNVAKRDVEQVQKIGRITRPFLGVRYLVINKDLAERNQLKVDHGVLISRGEEPGDLAVLPGSPADTAGIRENDIILALNGERIDEEKTLSSQIGHFLPGDTVTLRILRQGEERDVQVTLDEFKPPTQ